jgi:hypothetical protein
LIYHEPVSECVCHSDGDKYFKVNKIVVLFKVGGEEYFEVKSTDTIFSLKEQFEKRNGLLIVINKQINKYFP